MPDGGKNSLTFFPYSFVFTGTGEHPLEGDSGNGGRNDHCSVRRRDHSRNNKLIQEDFRIADVQCVVAGFILSIIRKLSYSSREWICFEPLIQIAPQTIFDLADDLTGNLEGFYLSIPQYLNQDDSNLLNEVFLFNAGTLSFAMGAQPRQGWREHGNEERREGVICSSPAIDDNQVKEDRIFLIHVLSFIVEESDQVVLIGKGKKPGTFLPQFPVKALEALRDQRLPDSDIKEAHAFWCSMGFGSLGACVL